MVQVRKGTSFNSVCFHRSSKLVSIKQETSLKFNHRVKVSLHAPIWISNNTYFHSFISFYFILFFLILSSAHIHTHMKSRNNSIHSSFVCFKMTIKHVCGFDVPLFLHVQRWRTRHIGRIQSPLSILKGWSIWMGRRKLLKENERVERLWAFLFYFYFYFYFTVILLLGWMYVHLWSIDISTYIESGVWNLYCHPLPPFSVFVSGFNNNVPCMYNNNTYM